MEAKIIMATSFIKWLRHAWIGCFNVWTHAMFAIDARYQEKFHPELFEKTVKALASNLLKKGVISVHEVYLYQDDYTMFRVNLKSTFDKRKNH